LLHAVEPSEDLLAFLRGDAGSVVFDFQHTFITYAQHHVAAVRRMCQSIVQQVAEQFAEQCRLAMDPYRTVSFERQ